MIAANQIPRPQSLLEIPNERSVFSPVKPVPLVVATCTANGRLGELHFVLIDRAGFIASRGERCIAIGSFRAPSRLLFLNDEVRVVSADCMTRGQLGLKFYERYGFMRLAAEFSTKDPGFRKPEHLAGGIYIQSDSITLL